jgi:hypothetical protein
VRASILVAQSKGCCRGVAMYTLNGIGTTCYGRANPDGDTFVATEWFVFIYFPIWPIRCRRMRVIGKDWAFLGRTTQYQLFEQINFADNLPQIGLTWLWTLVPLALLAVPASVSSKPGTGLFVLAGYFIAVVGFLGFAATRPGRRALTEGWHSVAGLTLLTLVLYSWPFASIGTWRVPQAGGIIYAPQSHVVGGALLFIALVWCGRVRRRPALVCAIVLAVLTSAVDIAFTWGRAQIATNSSLQPILGVMRSELWAASLLFVASAIVPALRRNYYWLIQLGLPALGWVTSSLFVPLVIPILHNQDPAIRWTILAAPLILTKTAAFGLLGSWLWRARRASR